MPQQAQVAPLIPVVLEGLEGIKEIHTAIAATTLLWMEEQFSVASDSFKHVLEIAERWDSAVELLKVAPESTDAELRTVAVGGSAVYRSEPDQDGGVLFDADEAPGDDAGRDEDVTATLDALRARGRAGQGHAVGADRLPGAVDPATSYSLVLVGNVFASRPEAIRGRLARELRNAVADHLRVPVVGPDEIRARLRVGPRQIGGLAVGLLVVSLVYVLVFSNQEAILRFFVGGGTVPHRLLAALVLLLVVPSFAFLYGSCVNVVTKLLRFD
jgi:hypothetical protein